MPLVATALDFISIPFSLGRVFPKSQHYAFLFNIITRCLYNYLLVLLVVGRKL